MIASLLFFVVQSLAYDQLTEEFFQASFKADPTWATTSGIHTYDSELPDISRGAIEKWLSTLKNFSARLAKIRTTEKLNTISLHDAQFLELSIQSQIFDLETLQTHRRNPMDYIFVAGDAIDGLMKRSFAPPEDRMKSLISRLRQIPRLMNSMKQNLQNPPREFTEIAIQMAEGSIGFFEKDLVNWVRSISLQNKELYFEFEPANEKAVAALKDALKFLNELLPRSKGSFVLGEKNFLKKLYLEEMVDLSVNDLRQMAEADLIRNQKWIAETATKINANKTTLEVIDSIAKDHPTAENLIPETAKMLKGIQDFILKKKILVLPNLRIPTVLETPPYARDGSFASMDTPGAFESNASEAFYYVTPVESDWDIQKKEEHLRAYNYPVLVATSIHEAFPGHFVQFLYAPSLATRVRKLLYTNSNVEGWAHYTEQMMIDEGYGDGDPKIRLGQLLEALLRNCRFVVSLKMHIDGISVDEGAKIFTERCYQQPANSFEEARRATYDPTYLYYAFGKLEILKLREDYRKAKKASLSDFHTAFLKAGGLPLKLIREELMK